jgi:hypothetical protein
MQARPAARVVNILFMVFCIIRVQMYDNYSERANFQPIFFIMFRIREDVLSNFWRLTVDDVVTASPSGKTCAPTGENFRAHGKVKIATDEK